MRSARRLHVLWLSSFIMLASDAGAAQDIACPTTASTAPPQFFAPAPYSAHAPFQQHFWYGTDALWTILREDGRWGASYLPKERVYRNKVFVWRKGYDPRTERMPALTLTAWRLNGSAPPIVVTGATNASGGDIGSAMLTAANLPATGCWELTAHYGLQTLTFVVSVP